MRLRTNRKFSHARKVRENLQAANEAKQETAKRKLMADAFWKAKKMRRETDAVDKNACTVGFDNGTILRQTRKKKGILL